CRAPRSSATSSGSREACHRWSSPWPDHSSPAPRRSRAPRSLGFAHGGAAFGPGAGEIAHDHIAMVIGARISIGLAVGLAVAAACHRQGPTARERVLAGLPADAVAVVAADGRALSHPRLRAVLDAAAVRWPSSLGCVVDAAVASDAVAATLDRAGNVT